MTEETIVKFDRASLAERLAAMSRSRRAIFAACCAERLFPFVIKYAEAAKVDANVFRRGLDLLWSSVSKASVRVEKSLIDELLAQIPDEDMAAEVDVPHALEAGASVVYGLRALSDNDPLDAAWAAESAYNVVDSIAQEQLLVDFSTANAESKVLHHEAVQHELSRQLDDLLTLERTAEQQLSEAALALRERAKTDPIRA